MSFLQPHSLHFLWLGLIPVVLWLFRRQAKRVPVSTLLFFRTLAREHQESAWLRTVKRLLALLLSLLVIACAALALARPYREGKGGALRSVVMVLDRSASMAATDGAGRSRLDEAKALLRAQLEALPENVAVSLLVCDAKPEVVQSRSTNRREMVRLLAQVPLVPLEDQREPALALARRLAALDGPSEIWLASDTPLTTEPSALAGDAPSTPVREFPSALAECLNVGITGFQLRPTPLARNRFEAFIEVTANANNSKPMDTTLEARLDGLPVQLRQLELKPGESARLILPLTGGRGQRLELETRTEGDCLVWDNVVLAPLPETQSLVVTWLAQAPDPFVELALTALLSEERIQILKGSPKDWPLQDKPDVYVFENWVPPTWPTDRPALVLNPPANAGPILAKKLERAVPYESVRAVQPEHPVLYRVASGRVAITQTTALQIGETLEPLWMAGGEPVLAAGEAAGQRLVVTAFQPGKSEQLALLSAFPLLIGNALYWCAENSAPLASLRPSRLGDLVTVGEGLVKWHAWDDAKLVDASDEPKSGVVALRRLGTWESATGKTGASMLLSPHETNVPTRQNFTKAASASTPLWRGLGNWSTFLMWAALILLLLDSWLFHRQTVY
ncbi:MAG: vWA domain-containing protein [Roseimicrobium sp.]